MENGRIYHQIDVKHYGMGSNSPLRLFPQRAPSKWISEVEFSYGCHPITKLKLWIDLLMISLGYIE